MLKYLIWACWIGFVLSVVTGVLTLLHMTEMAYFFTVIMFAYFALAITAPAIRRAYLFVSWKLLLVKASKPFVSADESFRASLMISEVEVYTSKRQTWELLMNSSGLSTTQIRSRLKYPEAITELTDSQFEHEFNIIGLVGLFRFGQDSNGLWWRIQDSEEVTQRWIDAQPKPLKRVQYT